MGKGRTKNSEWLESSKKVLNLPFYPQRGTKVNGWTDAQILHFIELKAESERTTLANAIKDLITLQMSELGGMNVTREDKESTVPAVSNEDGGYGEVEQDSQGEFYRSEDVENV